MEIQPLQKRNSLSADIARQLHDMIQSGSLKPGDRLPGQRDLAQRFGSSMASVREAVSALSAAGLLDAHPGRGTIIRGIGDAQPQFDGWLGTASDATQMEDLLETRRLLESFLVVKATQRATPEQRLRLRALMEDMRTAVADPAAYVEADLAFHLGIAEIAGNRVLMRMMKAIQAPMKQQLHHSNITHMARKGSMIESFDSHERLVEALERGDSQGAVACLEEMVNRASRLLLERKEG